MKISLEKFLENLKKITYRSIIIDYEIDVEHLNPKDFPSHINTLSLKNQARFSQWAKLLTNKDSPIKILGLENISITKKEAEDTLLHENCNVTGIGITNLSLESTQAIMSTLVYESCVSRLILGPLSEEAMKIAVSILEQQDFKVKWDGIEELSPENQCLISQEKNEDSATEEASISVSILPQYDTILPKFLPRLLSNAPCVLALQQYNDLDVQVEACVEITLYQNNMVIQTIKLQEETSLNAIVLLLIIQYCIEKIIVDGLSVLSTEQLVSAVKTSNYKIKDVTWVPDSLAMESVKLIMDLRQSILQKHVEEIRQRAPFLTQMNLPKRKEREDLTNGESNPPLQKRKY